MILPQPPSSHPCCPEDERKRNSLRAYTALAGLSAILGASPMEEQLFLYGLFMNYGRHGTKVSAFLLASQIKVISITFQRPLEMKF
jgi:hypothetical protein